MSNWVLWVVTAGTLVLLFYGYAVWFTVRGRGREDLEPAMRSLMVLGKQNSFVEIVQRGKGTILRVYRGEDHGNSTELRLRIPSRLWSLPHSAELQQVFSRSGFSFAGSEGSIEWVGEVQIPIVNIWSVGSAEKPAEAVKLALDVLGFEPDARFNFLLKGKKTWQRMPRRTAIS